MSAMQPAKPLDPQLGATVEASGHVDLTAENPAAQNLAAEKLAAEKLAARPGPTTRSDQVSRTDVVVPGDPDVRLRVHRAVDSADDNLSPCLFSMHAGGYVVGDTAMDDLLFDQWCPRFGLVGVSVEYRLAPAHPYPGPITDCYTGLTWVHEHAGELGIDRSRIGLHGVGAGGGLAAALALVARDHRDIPLAFQLLDSPMLDDRQQTFSRRLDGLAIGSAKSAEFGWRAYLGDRYGGPQVPIYAAAGRCSDLRGLPPSFVSVGSLDGFRDEAVDYAVRLNQAGVPTELHVYPGAPHGYQLAAGSDVARQSARDRAAWLGRQINR